MRTQNVGNSGFLDAVAKRFLDEIKQRAVFLGQFLRRVLLFFRLLEGILVVDVLKRDLILFFEHLNNEFVDLVRQIQHFVAVRQNALRLRKLGDAFGRFSRSVVDKLLVFLHARTIIFERRGLFAV